MRTGKFVFNGFTLVYDDFGAGPKAIVLLPPGLFSRTFHTPLAEALADRGFRVLTLDLLGHGESERPDAIEHYSIGQFVDQSIALLDHLGIEAAIFGGPANGAEQTLEIAARQPERVHGMILQMPVIRARSLLVVLCLFAPMGLSFILAEPLLRPLSRLLRRIPRVFGHLPNIGLDWLSQDLRPVPAALGGILFGRIIPPAEERRRLTQPALVIGNHLDPFHQLTDARQLAEELPNATLVESTWPGEAWVTPARITGEIADFADRVFSPGPALTAILLHDVGGQHPRGVDRSGV